MNLAHVITTKMGFYQHCPEIPKVELTRCRLIPTSLQIVLLSVGLTALMYSLCCPYLEEVRSRAVGAGLTIGTINLIPPTSQPRENPVWLPNETAQNYCR